MMWRPWIGRSCRSGRLSTGPLGPRLVSIVPTAGPAIPLGGIPAAVKRWCGQRDLHQVPPSERAARVGWLQRRPLTAPWIRVVWTEGSLAQPDGRGLLMPHLPTDPTSASRLSSPARLAANARSPAAVTASVDQAELPELTDPETAERSRWGRCSGSSGPTEGQTHCPRRSTAASRTELGVRPPLVGRMLADRREQAISAIADLMIGQLEREAQPPALAARGRGRVAGRSRRQEELP